RQGLPGRSTKRSASPSREERRNRCWRALRSWPRLVSVGGASIAEVEDPNHADQDGPEDREERTGTQIPRRQLRIGRQSIDFGLVHQQVERVESAEHLLVRAVEVGPLLSDLMELIDALLRSCAQLADRAELDRLGRACLGVGRLQAALTPGVAAQSRMVC